MKMSEQLVKGEIVLSDGESEDMVSWKMNKIDTVSPLRSRLVGGYSPRKKQHYSKSTASLGSLGNAWDKKGKQAWIHDHFFKRDCFKFVPDPKKPSGESCRCGRLLNDHNDPITGHNIVSWSPDSCTKKSPTDAFGDISFVGSANQSSRAPFVRVSEDTSVDLVMKLIRKVWKLEVPNLVISVTGGAKSFHLKPRLKEVFQRGLVKAAKSTGAWIITGGTNTGVMKHVGEAVRHMNVVGGAASDINVLGIATWGIVDRSADLISESGLGKHPARYRITPENASRAPLDSAHTHFILVDNGTEGQYGVEIDLRSKVEEAISKLHTESRSSTGSIEVPVVMLVLEGGPGTVETMTQAIKKKIPAVVIDGSGRAADIVAFAFKHTIPDTKNGRTVHVIDPNYKEVVEAKVVEVFGKKSLKSVYKMIEDVLEDEKMVTIYRLDEGGNASRDIDLAILKSLLKASRSSPLAQLNLALAWNRVDVAESDIFSENNRFKSGDLHNPMMTALLDEKSDFVRLFLENGVSFREFLNGERLMMLYRSVCNSGILGSLVRHQQKKRGSKYITPQLIGNVIQELMGDSHHSYYLENAQYFAESFRDHSQSALQKRSQPNGTFERTINMDQNNPLPFSFLDAFTWAILSTKKELAKLLWEKGPHPIATALFATKLLKEMAKLSQEDHQILDTTEGLLELADEFENFAHNILEECYQHDEDLAQSLLVRPLECFGNLTCIDIAQLASDQNFIGHACCQALFNRLWMGGIVMDTPWWKILICVLCPFLIYPLVFFVYDETEHRNNYRKTSQEDVNMNINSDVVISETKEPGNFRKLSDTIEMTNQNEQAEDQVKDVPSTTASRHNLLSEGDDDAVDVVFRRSDINCFERVYRFYEAPFTKFVANVCSYLIFLLVFCYVMLMDFQKQTVAIKEYVLIGWVGVLIIEEFRQIVSQEPKHFLEKIGLYFDDPWNFVDILSLLAFAIASVLRFFPEHYDGNLFEAARILYILDIIVFIVRSLQMFSVNRQLGPKLVMIRTMLEDLKQFIFILAVFVIGYGVAFQAALYPNTDKFVDVIKGILNKPYFQMYGELFYDDLFTDDTSDIHYTGKWLGPALLAVYMLLTNILLLNLLIAIFNYTFEKIQEGSDRVWKFQRYNLIREYHDRPTLVPPLMIFSHILIFLKWIIQICGCGKRTVYGSALKLNLSQHENEQLSSWENHSKEIDLLRSKAESAEKMEMKVKNIDSKVDALNNQIERMMEYSYENGNKCEKPSSAIKSASHQRRNINFETAIYSRVNNLEERLLHTTQTLDKILEIVSSSANVTSGGIRAQGISAHLAGKKTIHVKARKSPYPGSTIMRVSVPDEAVAWEVPLPNYDAPVYTSNVVSKNPPWADVEIMSVHPRPVLKFNEFDSACNVNRQSYTGTYKVVSGLPVNPMGRTGLTGRGLLGRFGPNHAADPIVTRWKMTSSGALMENGKKILEFVAIQRRDNQEWAIPGGMVEPGEQVSGTLKKEFMEEALAGLDMSPEDLKVLKSQVDALFQEGIEVFKGYVDDPRNTDVAWVETLAMNYHDDSGEVFNKIKLQAGDDATAVRWQRVSGNIPLYANHVAMLENIANLRNAHF